jgi:hypothetical protein
MRSELVGREVLHWWVRVSGLSDRTLFQGGRSVSPGVKHATYEMKVKSWNMETLINRSATEPS